jgi:hypothetical protein
MLSVYECKLSNILAVCYLCHHSTIPPAHCPYPLLVVAGAITGATLVEVGEVRGTKIEAMVEVGGMYGATEVVVFAVDGRQKSEKY